MWTINYLVLILEVLNNVPVFLEVLFSAIDLYSTDDGFAK